MEPFFIFHSTRPLVMSFLNSHSIKTLSFLLRFPGLLNYRLKYEYAYLSLPQISINISLLIYADIILLWIRIMLRLGGAISVSWEWARQPQVRALIVGVDTQISLKPRNANPPDAPVREVEPNTVFIRKLCLAELWMLKFLLFQQSRKYLRSCYDTIKQFFLRI